VPTGATLDAEEEEGGQKAVLLLLREFIGDTQNDAHGHPHRHNHRHRLLQLIGSQLWYFIIGTPVFATDTQH
jgi:hypothetical protein